MRRKFIRFFFVMHSGKNSFALNFHQLEDTLTSLSNQYVYQSFSNDCNLQLFLVFSTSPRKCSAGNRSRSGNRILSGNSIRMGSSFRMGSSILVLVSGSHQYFCNHRMQSSTSTMLVLSSVLEMVHVECAMSNS